MMYFIRFLILSVFFTLYCLQGVDCTLCLNSETTQTYNACVELGKLNHKK